MFWENISLALKEFGTSRMRTFLSVLGIVIGIGSVIAITTLGRSATVSVQRQVSQAGLGTIMVFPGRDSAREVRRLFTAELADTLLAGIEGVEAATPLNQGSYRLENGRNEYPGGMVTGVRPAFGRIYDYEVAQGTFLNGEDEARRRSVIVLGAQLAGSLFPAGDALGRYVRVYRPGDARSFKVIGVMREKTGTMGMDFDVSAYVPFSTYSQRLAHSGYVQRYAVGTVDGADAMQVAGRLEAAMLALTGSEEAYRVISPSTMAEMFTGITQTLNLFLTGVAAISLVVGGIGIMNIMLVSVTERTREIGVRKALGAAPRTIRAQFLVEAVTLTLVGGLIGMAAGTALSWLGTMLLHWSFAPSPAAYALAVLCSSGVGIFFGLYPAARASRLEPVAALAYE